MSTETKWTPGPWVVTTIGQATDVSPQNDVMAPLVRMSGQYGQDTQKANACLIAAAPKMYEALRKAEWSGPRAFAHASSGPTCPWCRQPRPPKNHLGSGHASDCVWVAALPAVDGGEMP